MKCGSVERQWDTEHRLQVLSKHVFVCLHNPPHMQEYGAQISMKQEHGKHSCRKIIMEGLRLSPVGLSFPPTRAGAVLEPPYIAREADIIVGQPKERRSKSKGCLLQQY